MGIQWSGLHLVAVGLMVAACHPAGPADARDATRETAAEERSHPAAVEADQSDEAMSRFALATSPSEPPSGQRDIPPNVLDELETSVCRPGTADFRDACARVRQFRAGRTPNTALAMGQRFLGYGYEAQYGFPGHHHGRSGDELAGLEPQLYLLEFREIAGSPRVAFLALEPETSAEYRDVPRAIAALRENAPIPGENVALAFARTYDIPGFRFEHIVATQGASLQYEYENFVAARVYGSQLILLELYGGGTHVPGQTWYLWVFDLLRPLRR